MNRTLSLILFFFHTAAALITSPQGTSKSGSTWKFRDQFDIHTEVHYPSKVTEINFLDKLFNSNKKTKPNVVLVHGFGCSTTYWRATIAKLIENGYPVHAIDLLGQGKSAKPGRSQGIEYSIPLWAEVVDSYVQENIPQLNNDNNKDVVLVGNSLGSLVALTAATGDHHHATTTSTSTYPTTNTNISISNRVKGICMFNCGVGLNSRGIAREPTRSAATKFAINALYDLLVLLIFNNRPLLEYALKNIVTRQLLEQILQSLYICRPDRVDDELVESFFLPAQDEGSVETLSQIYCNDPGKTPFDLHAEYGGTAPLKDMPIHLVWGNADKVTPLEGGVGQFYLQLAKGSASTTVEDEEEESSSSSFVSMRVLDGGHVPFDDNFVESNDELVAWLDEVVIVG